MLRMMALVVIGNLIAAAVIFSEEPAPDDAAAEIAAIQESMLAKNNSLRAARGLRAHKASAALMAAAQDHATFMARSRLFSHYSNGGPGGRAAKHGFGAGVLENIGYGYASVDRVFSGWHASGGHYSNMMSATSEAGFGLCYSANGTPYWVAVYGTPPAAPVDAPPDDSPANVSPETTVPRLGVFGWLFRRRG